MSAFGRIADIATNLLAEDGVTDRGEFAKLPSLLPQ
jgi:hypothetical protein